MRNRPFFLLRFSGSSAKPSQYFGALLVKVRVHKKRKDKSFVISSDTGTSHICNNWKALSTFLLAAEDTRAMEIKYRLLHAMTSLPATVREACVNAWNVSPPAPDRLNLIPSLHENSSWSDLLQKQYRHNQDIDLIILTVLPFVFPEIQILSCLSSTRLSMICKPTQYSHAQQIWAASALFLSALQTQMEATNNINQSQKALNK
eukprot:g51237.t1